ncbi:MAG: hypothetical protein WC527_07650 [Candidatus Margulisiibacteriota bacterium]
MLARLNNVNIGEQARLVFNPQFSYRPASMTASRSIQTRRQELNGSFGPWSHERAFWRTGQLCTEQAQALKKYDREWTDGETPFYPHYLNSQAFTEILHRARLDDNASRIQSILDLFRKDASEWEVASHGFEAKTKKMMASGQSMTKLLGRLPVSDLIMCLNELSHSEFLASYWVNSLARIMEEPDRSAISFDLSKRLRALENKKWRILQWDLHNRFPEKEGLVLLHGTQEPEYFYDSNRFFFPLFFSNDWSYIYDSYAGPNIANSAGVIAKIPFSNIQLAYWLHEKSASPEPEIIVSPSRISNMMIFFMHLAKDDSEYSRLGEALLDDQERYGIPRY